MTERQFEILMQCFVELIAKLEDIKCNVIDVENAVLRNTESIELLRTEKYVDHEFYGLLDCET